MLFLGKTCMMLPLLTLIAAETVGKLNSYALRRREEIEYL
jgi:hypothetical protein